MHSKQTKMIVVAAMAVLFIAIGIRSSFGIFLPPMVLELGWGRADFAFAIAIQNLLWGAVQPVAGAIADRFGARRVIAACAVLYAAGLTMMSGVASPVGLTVSAGVLIGLALSGTSFPVVLAVVGRAVSSERRSFWLGIVSAGGSSGQLLVIPFGQGLIGSLGWSASLLVFALVSALMVPLAAALVSPKPAMQAAAVREQRLAEALREAGGHSGFWYLTAGFLVCGFHVTFLATHLPAYLLDEGAGPMAGAWALALIGLGNIVGTTVCGVLGGRYRKKYVLSGLYLGRALIMTLFLIAPVTPVSIALFSLSLGLLWLGTVPLTSGLVAEIFGLKYMATLFGIVFFSHQIGSFFGAWYGGYIYDATGSYTPVWLIGIVLGVASAVLHWPIRDTPLVREVPQEA